MDNVSCVATNCSVADPNSNQEIAFLLFGLVLVLLILLGLVGNTLTILVVWLRPHMRSSTYLYLSSMAVSDLLILLLLPLFLLWNIVWSPDGFWYNLTTVLSEICRLSSIFHITALALERYLVVCWPITARTLLTRSRTRALIGCLWLGAAVSAVPVWFVINADAGCSATGDSDLMSAIIILSILYFLVPLCMMGVLHILIRRTLLLRPQSSCKDQSNRRAIRMLGISLLAFVLCLLPIHILESSVPFLPCLSQEIWFLSLLLVSIVLYYLSAAINPLLYYLMSTRHRDAVRSLVHAGSCTPSCRQRTPLASGRPTSTKNTTCTPLKADDLTT